MGPSRWDFPNVKALWKPGAAGDRLRLIPMNSFLPLQAVAVSSLCWSLAVSAADWTCWRGTDGLGLSPEKSVPVAWSKDKNLAWKTAVPGRGASSPIVVGRRVYLTSQTPDQGLHLLAFDRETGAQVWDTEIARGKLHALGRGAVLARRR